MPDVLVLKTGKLYESDMLANELEKEGIPHYRREENFAGLSFAMPAMPAPGPGVFFSVYVPEVAQADAEEILAGLPIVQEEPGLWSFSPRPWARKVTIAFAVLFLALFAVSLVDGIMGYFRQ